jgi:anti-sigma B factor antagonist
MSPADQHLTVELETGASPVRVVAAGEVDAASAPALATAIADASEAGGDVALDLGGVTFIDSSGLRVIAGAVTAADEQGRSVRVVAASSAVERIFAMTGLSELIDT